MTKLSIILFCLICWGVLTVNGQTAFVPSGGDDSGTNGSVSYTIGQLDYETIDGTSGHITAGCQQPYEISIITGKEEKNINLSTSVYPNPTASVVTLNTGDMDVDNMSYILIDVEGKLISSDELKDQQTIVSLAELATGTYFIKILNNNKDIKTFKIVKNN